MNDVVATAQECYRIVEKTPEGEFKSLFHALPLLGRKRSRRLPKGRWLSAERKPVSYGRGSPTMLSGFNVCQDLETCRKYLGRFKDKPDRQLVIVRCYAMILAPKPRASANIWLAGKLKIIEEVV
jgi:hypothetical protein